MKRPSKTTIGMFFLAVPVLCAGDNHLRLLPQLQPGQTVSYLIRYRSEKNVKIESNVAAPMAPNAVPLDAHGLFRMEVLDVKQENGKTGIRARGRFLNLDSGKPDDEESQRQVTGPDSGGKSVEFTISQVGSIESVSGLDSLSPEQQQAWQEWVARFAIAWTLPVDGVKIGQKWKSEQSENAGAPIAGLVWSRESTYVKDAPCHTSQISVLGDITASSDPPGTCAVLLTTALLIQKSSPKNATPDDFKIHELKTSGTAKGTNEIITYISLSTGLVVRATEEANQVMDVTVAKVDGSNRVHYNVDAESHSEVLLVTETSPNHP
jgi:hypothetical protein